jgi:hypothetical protein
VEEELTAQLVQTLQERAHLSADQAQQVAKVVVDFVQEHLPDIAQGFGGTMPGGDALGGIFGGRS